MTEEKNEEKKEAENTTVAEPVKETPKEEDEGCLYAPRRLGPLFTIISFW